MTKIVNQYCQTTNITERRIPPQTERGVYICPSESTRIDANRYKEWDITLPYVLRGDTVETPLSVIYNPVYKISYAVLKYGNFKYKVEDNKGVNRTNASNEDVCLAIYSQAIADEISNVGACYTGVKKAFLSSGIIDNYDDMPRGEAKESIRYFDAHPEKFKKITISKEGLKNLPAGRIIVFTKDGEAGHICITNGNGQGMSSSTDNLGWLDAKGDGASYVVYELTDGWKYDRATRKLVFNETK